MEIIPIDRDVDWIREKFKNKIRNREKWCSEHNDQWNDPVKSEIDAEFIFARGGF